MKKYTVEDVKSLTKAQVIELLKENGITPDESKKKEDLVTQVLGIEIPEESAEEVQTPQEGNGVPSDPEQPTEEQIAERKRLEEEAEAKRKAEESAIAQEAEEKRKAIEAAEKKLGETRSSTNADPKVFKAALEKRQKNNGGSNFKEELARRRHQFLKERKSFTEVIRERKARIKK